MAALQRQRAATLSLTHMIAHRSADPDPTGRGASAPASQAAAAPAPARSQPRTYGTSAAVGSPNPSPERAAGAPASEPGRVGAPDVAELVIGGATDGGIAVWDVTAAAAAVAGVSGLALSAADREQNANHHAAGGRPAHISHCASSRSTLHSAPGGAASADAGVERRGSPGAASARGVGDRRGMYDEGAAFEVMQALALPGVHQSGVNSLSAARCGAARPLWQPLIIFYSLFVIWRE